MSTCQPPCGGGDLTCLAAIWRCDRSLTLPTMQFWLIEPPGWLHTSHAGMQRAASLACSITTRNRHNPSRRHDGCALMCMQGEQRVSTPQAPCAGLLGDAPHPSLPQGLEAGCRGPQAEAPGHRQGCAPLEGLIAVCSLPGLAGPGRRAQSTARPADACPGQADAGAHAAVALACPAAGSLPRKPAASGCPAGRAPSRHDTPWPSFAC